MKTGILLILLIVAIIAIPLVVRVIVHSTVDTVAGKASSAYADRRRRHGGFITGLGLPDVLTAAAEAATVVPGGRVQQAPAPGTATVVLNPGAVSLAVTAGTDGRSRVRLAPAGPGLDDGELSQFRAALLARLRARDPGTSYT
jgi:hypothetical protein